MHLKIVMVLHAFGPQLCKFKIVLYGTVFLLVHGGGGGGEYSRVLITIIDGSFKLSNSVVFFLFTP
jgi:hypothetical protein